MKIKFFSKSLFLLNAILVVATILAYSAPYVNPASFFSFIAFLGLGLPYLLLANLVFVFIWLFKANSRFVLSLLIVGLGYQNIQSFVQIRFNHKKIEKSDFKIMSFNVRIFDLYMWTKDKNARNQIFDFLEKENPDVLCLQEFYHSEREEGYEFNTLDTLTKILTAKNYHVHYTTTLRKVDHWGIITFSKYPIINKGVVELAGAEDNTCIYSDLLLQTDTVRIYNAHLASIKLAKRDYKTIRKINEKDYSNFFTKSTELLEKIKFGFQKRSSQAETIEASISQSPHPIVVCGDFNDTPSSFAYQTIKGELKDAFIESGSGLGRTYIGEFPSFRIDYLLYSDKLSSKNYITHPEKLSDHHPISAYFSVNN